MRYALAQSTTNPLIRRKFYIGTAANITAALAPGAVINAEDYPGGDNAAGAAKSFTITAYRGEKTRKIPSFSAPDTGLVDGGAAAGGLVLALFIGNVIMGLSALC